MAKTKSKLSIIEIAAKQRYLYLLDKVKENKTLSRVELDELKRYERKAKLTTTADSKRLVKPVVSLPGKKRPGKKKASVKASKKKRRDRLSMRESKVRWLALECENLTEADATIGADAAIRTCKSLADILKKHPRLQEAWKRGRFLREVKEVAAQSPSISQAAGQLGFTERAFQELLSRDLEAADIWHQQQLQLYITVKGQIFDLAEEGNPWAIKTLDDFLQAHAGLKADVLEADITTDQLSKLTGKSIRTLHNWRTSSGLPRNPDKTYDLKTFFLWHEEFLLRGSEKEEGPEIHLDPLKAMKAEKLRVELASHKNQLVERNEIVIQQVAWCQNLITICERNVEELARLCCNQPREKIREIHRVFFRELHSAAVNVPKALHLPAAQEKKLKKILQELKPPGDKDEDNQ